MTTTELLTVLHDAGVRPYLGKDGGLRGRSKPGAYTDELRQLVDEHRAAIIDHVAAEQSRADDGLAEALQLLDRLAAPARDDPGRTTVLGVYRTLAARWHAGHDPKLLELPEALAALLERWHEERVPSGWR